MFISKFYVIFHFSNYRLHLFKNATVYNYFFFRLAIHNDGSLNAGQVNNIDHLDDK